MPSSSLSSKPSRGRPKGSTSTCSFCKVAGHTKTTCPKRKATLIDPTVKAAFGEVFDVQQSTTFLCLECASLDPLRPPIKIPNQLSPKASIPFSVAFRSFTISLKSGKWDMIPVWKYFFDKQVQKNPAKVPEIFHPSKISVDKHIRQQLLRGRYGFAKDSLISSKLAPFNDDTVSQLQSLHPKENFHTEVPLSPTY
ncbi:hypothetical protein GEMRC1_010077 [Eukaryota sp. GEM-RC1]